MNKGTPVKNINECISRPGFTKLILVLIGIFCMQIPSRAQQRDSVSVNSSVAVYSNGASSVPSFSLGKPAINTAFSIAWHRFSFDPQFAFSTNSKPWFNAFWLHYKALNAGNFKFSAGTGITYTYSTSPATLNGAPYTRISGHSFFNADMAPVYNINNDLSVGIYYLYGSSLENLTPHNVHNISFGPSLNNIPVAGKATVDIAPQVYFLTIDGQSNYNFSLTGTLRMKKWPFAVTGLVNSALTKPASGPWFLWSVGIIWAGSKKLYFS
jgi:hypothetical protein